MKGVAAACLYDDLETINSLNEQFLSKEEIAISESSEPEEEITDDDIEEILRNTTSEIVDGDLNEANIYSEEALNAFSDAVDLVLKKINELDEKQQYDKEFFEKVERDANGRKIKERGSDIETVSGPTDRSEGEEVGRQRRGRFLNQ